MKKLFRNFKEDLRWIKAIHSDEKPIGLDQAIFLYLFFKIVRFWRYIRGYRSATGTTSLNNKKTK